MSGSKSIRPVDPRCALLRTLASLLRSGKGNESVKAFQTERKWALLVRCGETYIQCRGNEVYPLQVLESTRSACIAEARSRLAGVSKEIDHFRMQSRSPSRDR